MSGTKTTREYRCPLRVSSQCMPPTPNRSGRTTCAACGSKLLGITGVYAVVPWRGDGRYTVSQAAQVFVRRGPAQMAANALGDDYVVRFIPVLD